MELEWDEAKREANLLKHGIDFADAAELLVGPRFEWRTPVGITESRSGLPSG